MNFIEKNTKKVALVLCIITSASAVSTVYAMENTSGWQGNQYIENNQAVTGWKITEEGTYYFDQDGIVSMGWKTIDNETFYFDHTGKKLSGIQTIDGYTYNFRGRKGNLLTGWSDDANHYYDKFGISLKGQQVINEKQYYFDENGLVQKNKWVNIDGTDRYFIEDGSMASGLVSLDGNIISFTDGVVKSGWEEYSGEKYYYDTNGVMQHGWVNIEGNDYYFNQSGQMLTNTEYDGFEFDGNGISKEIEKKKATLSSTSKYQASAPTSGAVGGVASAALAQVGVNQDCTLLATKALAANGINFHGWPADYMRLGYIVSGSEAQAGDLIYYANGGFGMAHIAVYIGGGQAVHGGYNGNQTVIASAYLGSGPVFIRIS